MSFSQTGSTIKSSMDTSRFSEGLMKPTLSPTSTISNANNPKTIIQPAKTTNTNNGSVVDYLNSKGQASDYTSRTGLASKYGIQGYSGTADQNTQLLNYLKGGSTPTTTSTSQNLGSKDTLKTDMGDSSKSTGMINLGDNQPKPYTNDGNLFGNVVTGLANTPNSNQELNDALKNREALQNEYQKNNNLIQSRGWDLSEQGGAQGMLKQSYNTANAAAEDRVQNALTSQGNQITALNNAGNLAKPILGSVGQVPYNPTMGTQGSYLGTTGGNSLNEIGKTLGQFNGAQTTAENQYVQTEAYKSAHQQAQNLQNQLGNLISSMGLNPNDLNVANQGLQLIAKNTSDSRYQILQNYITDVASRYAQVLTPTGGSQTDTVRDTAQGMINGLASGSSILQVLNSLDQQAQAVSSGVNTNNTGSVKGTTTSNSGSGSITPKGGLSF